jgi:1-acyl-sn-glycerol-3-phosphate acyltransferase
VKRRALRRVAKSAFAALDAIGRARFARGEGAPERADRLREALDEIARIHEFQIGVTGAWPITPAIFVANHVSYLDPVAIGARVPIAPIAKGEVAAWPVIGTAARSLGVTFVNRRCAWSGARALLRARAALCAGVSILNFPEGTTTDGTRLLPFHRGIFGLARALDVPVVPIALRYCSPDLAWVGGDTFLPHYLRTASRRGPGVHLEVGSAILPDCFLSADELAVHTHHRIARMLRDQPEPHGTVIRLRVPAARPDAVLPPARGRIVAAR